MPITAFLITIAALSILFNPAKVLAAIILMLLMYIHPLPSLLTLAALLLAYYYLIYRRK